MAKSCCQRWKKVKTAKWGRTYWRCRTSKKATIEISHEDFPGSRDPYYFVVRSSASAFPIESDRGTLKAAKGAACSMLTNRGWN